MARRVDILQVPGANDEAWRQVIAQSCYAAGWRYYEHWGGGELDIEPGENCVVVAWTRPTHPTANATWIVQTCVPEDALQALIDRFGATVENAPIHASARYLFATDLARGGAPVSSLYDPILDIPGLGQVANPNPGMVPPADAGGPLSLYRSIPPKSTSLSWSAAVLDFKESTSVFRSQDGIVVDLTGRRRILTQGPHISLPGGLWRVDFKIILDAHGSTVLRFEWGDAEMEETLSANGVYELSLTGLLDDPVLANLKTLLIVPRLDGHLTIGDLLITPVQRQAGA